MHMQLKLTLGLTLLALFVPALAQAAPSKDDLLRKSMPAGAAARMTEQAKADEALRVRVMELHVRKNALLARRCDLNRVHDWQGRQANMKEIIRINAELRNMGRGGAR